MPELIAHLIGDYCLQNHWMATKKTDRWWPALLHALFYGLPFLFLISSWQQWAVIVGTHLIIDRLRLAGYWVRFWGVGHPGWMARWAGPIDPPPPFLGVWLLIIVDNTLHLLINHLALRFL